MNIGSIRVTLGLSYIIFAILIQDMLFMILNTILARNSSVNYGLEMFAVTS